MLNLDHLPGCLAPIFILVKMMWRITWEGKNEGRLEEIVNNLKKIKQNCMHLWKQVKSCCMRQGA
jgi:hypothetical protein